jgi:DNA-directed RNA polymerase specialized sigma subunit
MLFEKLPPAGKSKFGCTLFGHQRDMSPPYGDTMSRRQQQQDRMDVMLPHYDATDAEKAEWVGILCRGNKVLSIYHEQAKAHVGHRYSFHKFRKDLFAAMKTCGVGPAIIQRKQMLPQTAVEEAKTIRFGVAATDLAIIRQIQKIEFTILCSVAKMIYKNACKWERRKHDSTLQFADFHQVGVMAVVGAIYQFKRENIELTTYFQHAIHRKILNETNSAKPLSAWPQKSKKLYGEFEAKQHELGTHVTFDEVAQLMKLGTDEVADLRAMLTHVLRHSEMAKDGSQHGEDSLDLGLFAPTVAPPELSDNESVAALAQIKMTQLERDVLKAYLYGDRGWATRLASENINPTTNEPYSRRAPRLILNRVLARIRDKMPEEAEAA